MRRMPMDIRPDHNQSTANFCFRLVVKFCAKYDLPYGEQKEINDFFLRDQVIPWSRLCKKFPGLSINKLFSSVSPEQINGWINQARESDPFYQPPNFSSYFSISWKDNIPVQSLVRTLKGYKQIEHVYYQHGPLHPPSIHNRTPAFSGKPISTRHLKVSISHMLRSFRVQMEKERCDLLI